MGIRLDPKHLCQQGSWGTRPCRSCNPQGLAGVRPLNIRPVCEGCDGSGWTNWAAMATEPWSEIIHGLWIGGHDFVRRVADDNESCCPNATGTNCDKAHIVTETRPSRMFEVIVSAYHRSGFEPDPPTEYYNVTFPDSRLDERAKTLALDASELIAERVLSGKTVLSRCQAGLNRSSLMAGLAMVRLGFSGADAVQIIRARRSPWALCNDEYARFIEGDVGAGV